MNASWSRLSEGLSRGGNVFMLEAAKSRVIINADDLGISLRVNDSIFELMECRRISSATLMATGPAFDDAVLRIPKYPHCSFGIHLNLTEFAPLSEKIRLHQILDKKGEFAGNRVRQIFLDAALRKAIYDEWRAQIEKIRSTGVKISHIDGHQHIHTVPALFFVLKRIQKTCNIKKVRISRTFIGKGSTFSVPKRLGKTVYNLAIRRCHRTISTDEFGSFQDYLSLARSGKFSSESIELATHPGNEGYTKETAMLDKEWQQSIPYPIHLTNYNEI